MIRLLFLKERFLLLKNELYSRRQLKTIRLNQVKKLTNFIFLIHFISKKSLLNNFLNSFRKKIITLSINAVKSLIKSCTKTINKLYTYV